MDIGEISIPKQKATDFPREGNGFSYYYARRQWSLADNERLRYAGLMRFEQSSGELVGLTRWNTEKPQDSPLFYVYLDGKVPEDKLDRSVLAPDATATTTQHTTILDEATVTAPNGTLLRFFTRRLSARCCVTLMRMRISSIGPTSLPHQGGRGRVAVRTGAAARPGRGR